MRETRFLFGMKGGMMKGSFRATSMRPFKYLAIASLAFSLLSGAVLASRKDAIEANASFDYSQADNYHAAGDANRLFNNLRGMLSGKAAGTSYDGLWDTYKTVYLKDNGKIKDYYSSSSSFTPGKDQAGSYSKEGDVYNREHSIPKSWWGGGTSNQGCDPFIVVPTDGYVNNRRSNYPFGYVSSATYTSNNGYSKLGSAVTSYGYSGTVFEPNDEVKGDLARIVFYAVTKYSGAYGWTKGQGTSTFSGNESKNFGLTAYAVRLLTEWNNLDKPDVWEKTVNDRLYAKTSLRNPYIDHPEYVNTLWPSVPYEGGEEEEKDWVTLNQVSASLSVGDDLSLVASSSASNVINWSVSSGAVKLSKTSSNPGEFVKITAQSAGTATVYASSVIKGETIKATCEIEVTEKVLSLSYEGELAITEYEDGEDFDPSGIAIYAHYGDRTEEVTDSVIFEELIQGDTSAIGHYGGRQIEIPGITVSASEGPGPAAEEGEITLDENTTGFSSLSKDSEKTLSSDGYEFGIKARNTNSVLFFDSGSGYIYNKTDLGTINKITVFYGDLGSEAAVQQYSFAASPMAEHMGSANQNGSTFTSSPRDQSAEITPKNGSFGFFNLSCTGSKNLQASKIVISYTKSQAYAEQFATDFLTAFTCDSTGEAEPSFKTGYAWSTLATFFEALSLSQQSILKTAIASPSGTRIEKAMTRYDYVVAKYGYENFIDRNESKATLNGVGYLTKQIDYTWAIPVVGLLAVGLGVTLFFAFKKKKRG